MKKCSLLLCFSFVTLLLPAQSQKKQDAVYQPCFPVIDGRLTDSCWQNLAPLDAFTTSLPVFGEAPKCGTEVRIFYTESALYIAARCIDTDARGVRYDGGIRDGDLTGDWFQLSLDTWNDDQLSFDFTVSAAGVQKDTRQFSDAWNARWQSAVERQADGWTLEMCIPFGALRYPANRQEHDWGLQCTRYDRSTGQTSTWSPQDPLVNDRVLQFGALTGLRNIRQYGRHQVAIHAGTSYATGYDFFYEKELSQTLGIDGRLGLNESTTLDFTLMPPLAYYFDINSFYYPNNRDNVYGNASLPQPRQLEAEEQYLFERGTFINYTPIAYGSSLSWRLGTLPSNEFLTYPGASELLNAFKLTTRTKGNWRFGMYNALLGPVKAEIVNIDNFTFRNETLQKISDYNYVTAEYLLPNTGFVQISNASLFSGPGTGNAVPALDFRLRDRQNAHEFAGSVQMNYQQIDTTSTLGHHYQLGIRRLNRRWGWHVVHSGDYNPATTFTPGLHYASSRAGVSYQRFQPNRRFLNVYSTAELSPRWAANPGEQTVWSLDASLGGLNWNFQRLEFYLATIPHRRIVRYENSGAYISRKAPPRAAASLAFTSDQRKRAYWTGQAGAAVNTQGSLEDARVSMRTVWVAGSRVALQLNVYLNASFDNLALLNTPGRWVFEQNDAWQAVANLEASWYPWRKSRIYAGFGWQQKDYSNRGALELQPDGQLVPVTDRLPFLNEVREATAHIGLQYFFKDISQIGLSWYINPQPSIFQPSRPFFYEQDHRADLKFIYVIGGSGKR